jgi:hypothetical protein
VVNAEGRNDVEYAAITVGGEVKRFYRFQTADDGIVDYYDETGKSAKKFLVRKPLAAGSCDRASARNHRISRPAGPASLLDHALQRARAIDRIVALVGEPVARAFVEFERDLALLQQLLQPRA